MATFPAYASLLSEGVTSRRASALERSEMESGPVKQLKSRSRVLLTRSTVYKLATLADYNSFITWFQDTINYGADWFDWTDPIDGILKSARIVSALDSEEPADGTPAFWKIRMSIEVWSG